MHLNYSSPVTVLLPLSHTLLHKERTGWAFTQPLSLYARIAPYVLAHRRRLFTNTTKAQLLQLGWVLLRSSRQLCMNVFRDFLDAVEIGRGFRSSYRSL